jgi:hypothetical protein
MDNMRKIILLVFGFLMVAQASEKKSDLTPDQALAQLLKATSAISPPSRSMLTKAPTAATNWRRLNTRLPVS